MRYSNEPEQAKNRQVTIMVILAAVVAVVCICVMSVIGVAGFIMALNAEAGAVVPVTPVVEVVTVAPATAVATEPAAGGGDEALDAEAVLRGEEAATVYGCVACHSADGSVVNGPSWLGLYGSEETLEGGAVVVVDDAYIRESILDPAAKLTAGFVDVMPREYGDILTDGEIEDLIAYMQSLQ